eukprot:TRINITY_DN11839_c0_g1_i3.p1 TRINITY_DN11839_c0_g1~~TRINITY_DN11839_c0_g1_i3.p1  ORF type:complete len:1114 (+),score=301.85 TRINITY_DN11839_c0_g1_i3:290-3631(+)
MSSSRGSTGAVGSVLQSRMNAITEISKLLSPDKLHAFKQVLLDLRNAGSNPKLGHLFRDRLVDALGVHAPKFLKAIQNNRSGNAGGDTTAVAPEPAVVSAAPGQPGASPLLKPAASLQMNVTDATNVGQVIQQMVNSGVPLDNEYLVDAVNIVRTFVSSLRTHMKGDREFFDVLPPTAVFTEHQLQLLKSQVNSYQLLIAGTPLERRSLEYLKKGTGKPPKQLMTSPNNIIPQQPNPTLGQRLLCMVAHAPSRCPKIQDNHSFIDREYRTKLAEKNKEELEMAARAGVTPSVLLTGQINHKLSTLQANLRKAVLVARDDERSDKKLRKWVETVKKEKEKQHSKYLSEVKDHHQVFRSHHRECHKLRKRLANQAVQWHNHRERQGENDERAAERDRVKALREHDEETYLRLLANSKNERIRNLLKQTDQFMNELLAKVEASRPADAHNGEQDDAMDHDHDEDDIGRGIKKNNENYNKLTHRIQEKVSKQPDMMDHAGTMREYQLMGLQWMASLYNNGLNGILADEMGLGKTIQTVSLLAYLWEQKHNKGPFLCIVPLTTLHNNWKTELAKWVPQLHVTVYEGKPDDRKRIRETRLDTMNFNVLLTTFEYAMLDKRHLKKIEWEYIIVDEAHRLKNPKCKLSRDLNKYYNSKRRLALTGTPLQNDLQEVWALLNFLSPAIFNSIETFDQWFNKPFAGTAGEKMEMTEEEKLLIVERLHKVLRPFILRREKSQVESQLPSKMELVIKVRMSAMQKAMYTRIEKTGKLNGRSMQNHIMQLRKVCNHPYLQEDSYHINEDLIRASGKVELMDRLLPKMQKAGHRILMFSQMTQMIDIMEDYFRYRGFKHMRLDGNTDTHTRERLLKTFNTDFSYFIFILSTKAGGLGLNLQSADTVIIFDSDWNPQMDLQAMARAHRIGQKKQVLVLRLVTEQIAGAEGESVEEQMLKTAYGKLDNEAMVIQAGMFNDRYDKDLATSKMEALLTMEGDEREEDEIDAGDDNHAELSELNSRICRGEEEYELFQRLDAEMAGGQNIRSYLDNRIMSEEELPDWLRGDIVVEPDPEDPLLLIDAGGRGQRKHKVVAYADNRTEAQWLKDTGSIVEDEDAAPDAKKRKFDM